MRNLKINPKAQSILEYVIILTVIIGAVILGAVVIKNKLIGQGAPTGESVSGDSLFGKSGKVITDFTGKVRDIK